MATDILATEAGVTAQVSEQIGAYIEVAANFGEDFSDYLLSLGMEWKF